MATTAGPRASRLGAAFRQEDRVMPLELFFDLVFVRHGDAFPAAR